MKRQARVILAIAILVLIGAGVVIGVVISRAGVVAELLAAEGSVQSQHAGAQWTSAPGRDRYRLGDAVRTGERSTARVRMRAGGGIELRPRTTVHFAAARPGTNAPAIRIERGEVQLQADSPMSISTGGGVVRVEPGGRVRLTADGLVLHVRVDFGRAVVERDGAPSAAIAEGATVDVSVEGAIPQRELDAGTATNEAPVRDGFERDGSARDAFENDGSARDAFENGFDDVLSDASADSASEQASAGAARAAAVFTDAPAELSISAGESASVHAPALPVRVKIELGARCAAGAQVSVSSRGATHEARATGSLTLALSAGVHAVRARCDGARTLVRSTIDVDSASGAAALPSRPAQSDIEIDGHHYTVLYQNLLPILRVRWPSAPPSSAGYALRVRDARGRESTVDASSATITLTSGQVRDGTVRLSMQAKSGGARSPETSVTVLFDNDANTAHIRAPRPGEALSQTVTIEGTALEGSTVTAGTALLPLDGQRRFQGEIALGASPSLVIMIRHRSSGTHYYVRRASP
jgi:hypothetical protein